MIPRDERVTTASRPKMFRSGEEGRPVVVAGTLFPETHKTSIHQPNLVLRRMRRRRSMVFPFSSERFILTEPTSGP